MSRNVRIITTHLNADFDCLASMMAAAKLYPGSSAVFSGSQEKNVRDFLAHEDISLPIVRLKNLDIASVTEVVMVDASSRGRIGPLAELVDRPGVKFTIYDHHTVAVSDIPSAETVIRKRGATATIMVEILRERGLSVTPGEATLLTLGIYEDTGSLCFPSTTPEDFEAAGWLLRSGSDLNMVASYTRRELSAEQIDTLNNLLKSLQSRVICGRAVAVATAGTERYIGDVASLAHKIMDIENLDSLFILVRMEERVHLVARSKVREISAGAVATLMGGGGHKTAASATIKGMTLTQAGEKVWEALRATVEETVAASMMVENVITVTTQSSVAEAETLMTRYDINGLPVMDGAKVAGLITRQIVEKAIHHGLGDHRASEFMISEFVSVHPNSPYGVVEQVMLGMRQKQVPVVDEGTGALVGLLCRGAVVSRLYGESLVKGHPSSPGLAKADPAVRDVGGVLRERLPAPSAKLVHVISDIANKSGCTAYLAGGSVRDLLLRIPSMDMDVVIEGDAMDFAQKLAARLSGRARIHEKFKTAVVVAPGGLKIDVATARMEYYTHPAALPIVELSAIRNDLYRRDFSVNAMAIRLNGARPNVLLDFFGGQADIKDKIIRVLHNLSFVEDPTRVFRAVRFESRHGFSIAKQTLSLLKHAVQHEMFNRLSGARLFAEIKAILNERRPTAALKRMKELGLLRFIHPNLSFGPAQERLMDDMEDMLIWMGLAFPLKPMERWPARLLVILDPLSDAEVVEMMETFHSSHKILKDAIRRREFVAHALEGMSKARPTAPPSALWELFHQADDVALLYLAAKSRDRGVTSAVTRYISEYAGVRPFVTGEDVLAMGAKPSRRVGDILREIFSSQLDKKITSKEEAVQMARELLDKEVG
jgi:tRNA nucleotidyltransferase (CCA-adding enzyme)